LVGGNQYRIATVSSKALQAALPSVLEQVQANETLKFN